MKDEMKDMILWLSAVAMAIIIFMAGYSIGHRNGYVDGHNVATKWTGPDKFEIPPLITSGIPPLMDGELE